jgi:hypothetical protein
LAPNSTPVGTGVGATPCTAAADGLGDWVGSAATAEALSSGTIIVPAPPVEDGPHADIAKAAAETARGLATFVQI